MLMPLLRFSVLRFVSSSCVCVHCFCVCGLIPYFCVSHNIDVIIVVVGRRCRCRSLSDGRSVVIVASFCVDAFWRCVLVRKPTLTLSIYIYSIGFQSDIQNNQHVCFVHRAPFSVSFTNLNACILLLSFRLCLGSINQ